jgi:hypothetical protein
MASALYDRAKQGFMNAELDMDTDDIRMIFVNVSGTGTLYTFSAAHQFLSDVGAATRISDAAVALSGRTITSGVFDATDTVFTAEPTDNQAEALIIYKHTGVEGTSLLVAYIDGFTVTPNGGNITFVWDNGANKIFRF